MTRNAVYIRRNTYYSLRHHSRSINAFIRKIEVSSSTRNRRFIFALNEWEVLHVSDPSKHYDLKKCVCGGTMKRAFTIRNTITGIKLDVAAKHIESILNDDTQLVFKECKKIYDELRKLTKCVENFIKLPKVSKTTVNYLYSKEVISETELKSLYRNPNDTVLLDALEGLHLINSGLKTEYASRKYQCKLCDSKTKSKVLCLKCYEQKSDLCPVCGQYKTKCYINCYQNG